MELTGNTIFLLGAGALVLALIAVLVDRLNFPQARFRPRQIRTSDRHPTRDRTGAQIIEVDSVEEADERLSP
jgi:hypothetical protein